LLQNALRGFLIVPEIGAEACASREFNCSRFAGTSKKPRELSDTLSRIFERNASVLNISHFIHN
jgi:hypothetical protein